MNLSFTPEEQQFQQDVRGWLAANAPQAPAALTYERDFVMAWEQKLASQGWLASGWPKKFGGTGWSAVTTHSACAPCAATASISA